MQLGIDFGTSYSSAAFLMDGQLKLVKEPLKHTFSFPSSIYVTEKGDVLVGQAAENRKRLDASRYQAEFKRDLGASVPFQLGERAFLPEDLVTHVLTSMKSEAEKMTGKPFESAVVTLPATYEDHKRGLMQQAALKAGFKEVELLEEPVAAALYYAQQAGGQAAGTDEEVLLVYDFGGGTFDTALLKRVGSRYEFLGYPMGLPAVGGIDFDLMLLDDIRRRYTGQLEAVLADRGPTGRRARLMLLETCQTIKHQLSMVDEHEEMIFLPDTSPVDYQLTRTAFNQMAAPYVEQTLACCRRMVDNAGLKWEQVNRVLLVGGSCRIPFIEETLRRKFGLPISRAEDLELVVALGAAIRERQSQKEQAPQKPAKPRSEILVEEFEKDIQPVIDKLSTRVNKLNLSTLNETLADQLSRKLVTKVVKPKLYQWRNGEIKTLNLLSAEIEAASKKWLNSRETRADMSKEMGLWSEPIREDINRDLKPIAQKYHMPSNRLQLSWHFDPELDAGGAFTLDVEEFQNVLGNIVAGIVVVIGALVIAISATVTLGFGSIAVIGLGALGGKAWLESVLKDMDIPKGLREKALPDSKITLQCENEIPKAKASIKNALDNDPKLKAQLSQEVKKALQKQLKEQADEMRAFISFIDEGK